MSDIQIVLIGLACIVALAAFVVLCDRVRA
jgi:hypothetical protein